MWVALAPVSVACGEVIRLQTNFLKIPNTLGSLLASGPAQNATMQGLGASPSGTTAGAAAGSLETQCSRVLLYKMQTSSSFASGDEEGRKHQGKQIWRLAFDLPRSLGRNPPLHGLLIQPSDSLRFLHLSGVLGTGEEGGRDLGVMAGEEDYLTSMMASMALGLSCSYTYLGGKDSIIFIFYFWVQNAQHRIQCSGETQ